MIILEKWKWEEYNSKWERDGITSWSSNHMISIYYLLHVFWFDLLIAVMFVLKREHVLLFSTRKEYYRVCLRPRGQKFIKEKKYLWGHLSAVLLRRSSLLSIKYIRWNPAPFPYVTINIDGSSISNPEKSSAGGVARSTNGDWLWGFSLHLGVTNNTMAELWGLREAMARAWAKGHHWARFQTDSLLAYKWLTTNTVYPMEFSNLILNCRWLLNRD